jgi:hypothetical protein
MTKMVIKLIEVLKVIIDVLKEGINMIDLYIALVIAGIRTCNIENKGVTQFPTICRGDVIEELAAIGFDACGNSIV